MLLHVYETKEDSKLSSAPSRCKDDRDEMEPRGYLVSNHYSLHVIPRAVDNLTRMSLVSTGRFEAKPHGSRCCIYTLLYCFVIYTLLIINNNINQSFRGHKNFGRNTPLKSFIRYIKISSDYRHKLSIPASRVFKNLSSLCIQSFQFVFKYSKGRGLLVTFVYQLCLFVRHRFQPIFTINSIRESNRTSTRYRL